MAKAKAAAVEPIKETTLTAKAPIPLGGPDDFSPVQYEKVKTVLAALLVDFKDQVDGLSILRAAMHEISPLGEQPIDHVRWVPIEMVTPNDYNPNSVAGKEMTLLYHSIKHDGYCVEKSTPILKADLTWAPAGDLKIGDKLIAFDEDGTVLPGGSRKQRRYRTSVVEGNAIEESPLVEVLTDRGAIRVTPDHPFLTKRCYGKGHYQQEWVVAEKLSPDDIVIYTMKPWKADRSWEGGWLAGFLDGEGTLAQNQAKGHKPGLRLAGYQRPSKTADFMIAEMTRRVETKIHIVDRTGHEKWNSMVMARVDRLTDVMTLLGSVRPQRLLDVGGEFWDGVALSSKRKSGSDARVISVTKSDAGEIARLSTSTRTYIANGFAVHNTQPVVTVFDPDQQKFVIVDGFHRYFTCKTNPDILARNRGRLPIVVLQKDINDRMAATVRHNRARGKHSVAGMSNMVFQMLDQGMEEAAICNELGMEPEELLRLKHITGFSKLFEDVEYKRAWMTKRQVLIRRQREQQGLPNPPA